MLDMQNGSLEVQCWHGGLDGFYRVCSTSFMGISKNEFSGHVPVDLIW